MKIKCEKEFRGDVLRILKTAFPMGLTAGCLCKTINKAGKIVVSWDSFRTCNPLNFFKQLFN